MDLTFSDPPFGKMVKNGRFLEAGLYRRAENAKVGGKSVNRSNFCSQIARPGLFWELVSRIFATFFLEKTPFWAKKAEKCPFLPFLDFTGDVSL